MVNIIICDDNDKDRKNILDVVNNFMEKNKIEFKIHLYNDYNKNFNEIIDKKLPFKIYLLDIETPSASGIDMARKIRNKDVDSVIIFLTVHEELGNVILKNDLMFLSFINKFDNLKLRLNKSLKKALDLLNHKSIIKFTDRNTVYTIDMNDILYLTKESFERKTIIKTDYAEFKVNKTLNELVKMLDDRFIQTHRSCYINNDRKVSIDKTNKIILFDNGESTDLLSDKYRKVLN
ncbi:MAG: response regulator transcription factor [Firmicutes bacterium]|nr:response regulator transcription factor [Bacillota bacterium]